MSHSMPLKMEPDKIYLRYCYTLLF